MKQVSILAVFFLSSVAFANNVVELDDSNFNSFIRSRPVALVEFTVTWCIHCQALKPEFSRAADTLKIEDPTITLINVDCEKGGKQTCRKFRIPGYPTIILFKNGARYQNYVGERTATAIVTYMQSQSSSNL